MRRPCEVQVVCETPRKGHLIGLSVDHDELENGVGHFPVGIVEYEDGHLGSVYVRHIRMTDQKELPEHHGITQEILFAMVEKLGLEAVTQVTEMAIEISVDDYKIQIIGRWLKITPPVGIPKGFTWTHWQTRSDQEIQDLKLPLEWWKSVHGLLTELFDLMLKHLKSKSALSSSVNQV